MNIHKVTICSIVKPRVLIVISKVTRAKYDVTKRNVIKSLICKRWRRDYKFNVNKDQLPLAFVFYKNSLWNGDFLSFKSTTHDIIEFIPVLLVIFASHIRPRAMITASRRRTEIIALSLMCEATMTANTGLNNSSSITPDTYTQFGILQQITSRYIE